MDTKYTAERNVQILIYLLKAHGIKYVIASPGTTNMTFVASIQQDPFFEIFSSVDERSAAYLACGIAAASGSPVVLSCTGATASRNYMPGLTEAYYRKLPVLAVTSHRGHQQIGHLLDQQIDRRTLPNDIAIESVTLHNVHDETDEKYCVIEANKAILAMKLNGGGPAHINLYTTYNRDFSVVHLPAARVIQRHTIFEDMPKIPDDIRVAVFIGSHKNFSKAETEAVDCFCASHNAVAFCDHTSNFYGHYAAHMQLVFGQMYYESPLRSVDLVIHIGEVSGDAYRVKPKEVWRVSEDGALRDMFGCLTHVFMMPENVFFEHYANDGEPQSALLDSCREEYDDVFGRITDLPFGNLWMAHNTIRRIPEGAEVHMGIYNSLRSWSFFTLPGQVKGQCNVGGFGIDGGISTMMGSSIVQPNKLIFGIFGDLSFFYDMNVLGNRHIGNNVRMLLINNAKGAEFRLKQHLCYMFGEDADKYMAAAGHYGNKSAQLVKHYSEDLGYQYLCATNKEEFLQNLEVFVTPERGNRPVVFEVFTNSEDESEALETILQLKTESSTMLKTKIKQTVMNIVGRKGIQKLKGLKK